MSNTGCLFLNCLLFFAARQFVRLDTLIFFFVLYFDRRSAVDFCDFPLLVSSLLVLFQMTAGMSRKSLSFVSQEK